MCVTNLNINSKISQTCENSHSSKFFLNVFSRKIPAIRGNFDKSILRITMLMCVLGLMNDFDGIFVDQLRIRVNTDKCFCC